MGTNVDKVRRQRRQESFLSDELSSAQRGHFVVVHNVLNSAEKCRVEVINREYKDYFLISARTVQKTARKGRLQVRQITLTR